MRRASQVRRAICCALQGSFDENHRRRNRAGNLTLYGLRVPGFSPDLRHIDLALGYLAGESYCCGQVSCDVPFHRRSWWQALRKQLARAGVRPPPGLTFHVAVFTEQGAVFPVWGTAKQCSLYECEWRESEAQSW